MTEALQRQLANDEPKCGNCRHWRGPRTVSAKDSVVFAPMGRCGLAWSADLQLITTDLQICSAWERKPNAQTEAETQ